MAHVYFDSCVYLPNLTFVALISIRDSIVVWLQPVQLPDIAVSHSKIDHESFVSVPPVPPLNFEQKGHVPILLSWLA